MGKPMAFLKFSCFAILFLFFIYTLSPIGNFLFSHVYMYSTGGGGRILIVVYILKYDMIVVFIWTPYLNLQVSCSPDP